MINNLKRDIFISQNKISKNAINVLYCLKKSGFDSYLVGGGIRDIFLNKKPKDFDVATNATPQQIIKLFRNCLIIGRRFILVHVIFEKEIIEISTFRKKKNNDEQKKNKKFNKKKNKELIDKNVFGSIKEDSLCRDFSVNSLYYDIFSFTLKDYNNGIKDLQNGIIKTIGNPENKYKDDPIIMLRAIRFSAKLNMVINEETIKSITKFVHLLYDVPPTRLFEEILKLFYSGNSQTTYHLICKYKIFQLIFPIIDKNFNKKKNNNMNKIILIVLENIDLYPNDIFYNNPIFLFSIILWYPFIKEVQEISKQKNIFFFDAFLLVLKYFFKRNQLLFIPKNFSKLIRNMWKLQIYLLKINIKKNIYKIKKYYNLYMAYKFYILRYKIKKNKMYTKK